MHGWKWRVVALVGALVALPLVGCGDDGGGSVEAYCDLINEQPSDDDGVPTDEELDEVSDAAPSEIQDAIDTVVDALRDDPEALFEENEELQDAFAEIQEFEEENCTDESGE